jgi:Tfp pilus assembly protein PilX
MTNITNRINLARHQTGSSLVVSMIMLVVLMLMGVGAIVVSNTQYRMAGNFQFQNQAMAAAESALSQAELWITANVVHPELAARVAGGHYPLGTGPDPYTMPWNNNTSETVGGLDSQRYIIEVLGANRYLPASSVKTCPGYTLSGPCSRVNVYRITARGTCARGSVKIVQSVFTVQVSI